MAEDHLQRRPSTVVRPRRSPAAVDGIALLKRGAPAIKISTKDKPKFTVFRLDEEETALSGGGSVLGKMIHQHRGEASARNVSIDEILEIHVGTGAIKEDLLALERTENLAVVQRSNAWHGDSARSSRASAASRTSARYTTKSTRYSVAAFAPRLSIVAGGGLASSGLGGGGVAASSTGALADAPHLRITLVLIGSLPMPPSLDGDDGSGSQAFAAPAPRKSLIVQCQDEESLGLWLAALRTLMAERQPPSEIGPAALMGSFGCPLEEVALADASIGEGNLLVPAVLEALWQSLVERGGSGGGGAGGGGGGGGEGGSGGGGGGGLKTGLNTEGVFRLSAAESELNDVRRRIQEADECESAIRDASDCCLAALIKLYLRELP